MKKLIAILMLAAFSALADDKITVQVTVTNETINADSLTANADTRRFTNSVSLPTVQVSTNSTAEGSKTNLYNHLALNPFSQTTLRDGGTNWFYIVGASAAPMTLSATGNWAALTFTTQTVSRAVAVRIPVTIETAAQQTNIASGLVAAIGADYNTNVIYENAPIAARLVGLTNVQHVTGAKTFDSPILDGPTTTNLINYGDAISSPGAGSASQQFAGGIASGANSIAIGQSATAGEYYSLAIGAASEAAHTNSVAIGTGATTVEANQIMLGGIGVNVRVLNNLTVGGRIQRVQFAGTNNFPTEADISFQRFAIGTLANGVNAAVPVGTNVFIEVSGPTGAFSIDGIANGRDGKLVVILNQTGQDMTIAHQSGSEATAANRIITMTGADRATTANGAATLIYSGNASRWILISIEQ